MVRYVERATADRLTGQEIVEQLGVYLAARYQAVETYLLAEIARRVARDLDVGAQTVRLGAVGEIRQLAAETLARFDTEVAARRVVLTAITEGEAAAIETLGFTKTRAGVYVPPATGPLAGKALPFAGGLTPTSATAAATLGFELSNALADVNARILRNAPDVYQATIARFAGERLISGETGRQVQTRAATDFLANGIAGFRDSAGRDWRIGTYTEMATRTATNRAWIEAHSARFGAMDVRLVQIIRGADACPACAAWAGKILATSGPTGTLTVRSQTDGRPQTITVDGTLQDARNGGWNHPNCRCTIAPYFVGTTLLTTESTYDPQGSKNRDRLRALERRVRTAKRKQDIARALGDDVGAARYRTAVREGQSTIRAFTAETGQIRKPYREQLAYSDGTPPRTVTATPVHSGPGGA